MTGMQTTWIRRK